MERHVVNPILESPATWILARILATFMYWYAGLGFLFDFPGAIATMQAEGFTSSPASIAALTIAVQLTGAALVIHGRFAWFGAGMLAVFTLATIPMVHAVSRVTPVPYAEIVASVASRSATASRVMDGPGVTCSSATRWPVR